MIAPTREIAVQGSRLALDIAGPGMSDLKVQTFIGGIAVAQDEIKLKKCHLAVGTPGKTFSINKWAGPVPNFTKVFFVGISDRQKFGQKSRRLPKAEMLI